MLNISLSYFILIWIFHCGQAQFVPEREYKCEDGDCVMVSPGVTTSHRTFSLEICRLLCDEYASLWPKPGPNANLRFDNSSYKAINLTQIMSTASINIPKIWRKMFDASFSDVINNSWNNSALEAGIPMSIHVHVASHDASLTLDTNEIYNLTIKETNDAILVQITADNIYGARHALTTLTQLLVYDEVTKSVVTLTDFELINDGPAYPYRGLSLDTSRNFYPIKSIERTIIALSYNRMNRLHWHMTDSNSWAVEIPSVPNMLAYGAYSNEKVYTKEQIANLQDFALLYGIAIVPEIDAPAHVGPAFSWDGKVGEENGIMACLYLNPDDVLTAPFGYLNPISNSTYELFNKIYADYKTYDYVKSDMFHLGADEVVSFDCWNSTQSILNYMEANYGGVGNASQFHKLWADFEKKNSEILKRHFPGIKTVIWSSSLTSTYPDILKRNMGSDVIVEVWSYSSTNDAAILLDMGFKILMANADAWYLDCGMGSSIAERDSWCRPFKEWQIMYNNRPDQALYGNWTITDKQQLKNILGGEAAIWSEQIDHHSLEVKTWPRTAAVAERLWSNPDSCWFHANGRMQIHRNRLVSRGIKISADAIQPEWCLQHEDRCIIPLDKYQHYKWHTTCEQRSPSTKTTTISTSTVSIANLGHSSGAVRKDLIFVILVIFIR